MSFSAINVDRGAVNNFVLLLRYVSAYRTVDSAIKPVATPYQLPLQFPPKIKKDERGASLNVGKMLGREPIVVMQSNDPRKITLEFTYVVEGGVWSSEKIASICKKLRSYYLTILAEGFMKNLAVFIPKFWLFGGYDEFGSFKDKESEAPFVIESINISHSDTLVATGLANSNARYDYNKFFPLRTDISMSLITADAKFFSQKTSKDAKVDDPEKDAARPVLPVEWH
jgi:hypothetical protein